MTRIPHLFASCGYFRSVVVQLARGIVSDRAKQNLSYHRGIIPTGRGTHADCLRGYGRLTRTITDMLLSRADQLGHRFYSVSAEILRQKKEYYEILEKTTTHDCDISSYLEWFLHTIVLAMSRSETTIRRTVHKSLFWE